MGVKKTELVGNQILRLYNHTKEEDGRIKSAQLCEVEGTTIRKIEIEFYNMAKESFFPDNNTLDYILNGVHVERNKE